jgi:hypothetical protein
VIECDSQELPLAAVVEYDFHGSPMAVVAAWWLAERALNSELERVLVV